MKKVEVFRFLNVYTICSVIFLFCSLFLSWFFTSDIYYLLFIIDFQNEPDLIGLDPKETVITLLNQLRSWEKYIDSATRYTIFFIPIVSLIPILQFKNELNGYLSYACLRLKSFKKYMFLTILKYSTISGLCMVIPYIVFFSIGNIYMIDNIEYIGNFLGILGPDFYNQHTFLYYIILTISIYFFIGFTFGMMGISIAIWTEKTHLIIIIPTVYYIVIGNLAETFKLPLLNIMHSVTAYNTLYNTWEIFVPLVLPLVLSFTLILHRYIKGDSLDY